MRRKIQIVGASLMMGMMCGCLQDVPLTDKEMDVVAEYAAEVLLENDSKFISALLSQSTMEELLTPTPTSVPIPTSIVESSDKNGATSQGQTTNNSPTMTPLPGDSEEIVKQLNQLMGQDGFRLSYQGYTIENSITSDEYYHLEAEEGKQYIVVEFEIENQTEKELVFDASNKNLTCVLAINLDNRYRAALSMIENDLQYRPIAVPAKETKPAVLIFEVKKEDISTINLILENDKDNVVFIKMK